MKLTFDLESRSRVDLIKCGMYRYAEDESTDIMCFAFKEDNNLVGIWVPEKFHKLVPSAFLSELNEDGLWLTKHDVKCMVNDATIIEAHNAGFESSMWHQIMHKRYGLPDLPKEKLRCSAAQVAAFALPRSLEWACKATHVDAQKDTLGRRVMLKMCKPRKPTKARPEEWNEDPKDFEILCRYCMQDVDAEHALSKSVYDLPDYELEVWQMDQDINERGVKVDIAAINNLISKVKEKTDRLSIEVQKLTDGISPTQVVAIRGWMKAEGVDLKDLTKSTVEKTLTKDIPANVRKVLEIRQSLSKSSVSKLNAMERMACKDERVRGSILYHAARTGRFGGRGFQPQNFPRDSYDALAIDSILKLDTELVEFLYGCPIKTASKCLRGMITAGPGNELITADYSSIEGRVLAWLAGEDYILQGYHKGLDTYKIAASPIFEKPYDAITKSERQVGKVIELSCGYQGYVGAFAAMASNYGVSYPASQRPMLANKLIEKGERVTESGIFNAWAAPLIMSWRKARPNTVAYWSGVMGAALKAIKTGKPHAYGRIKFGIRGRFLHCRLPSGRLLSYCDPKVILMEDKYKREKEVITFWGVSSDNDKVLQGTRQWGMLATYGGKLTENIVQATSRDILTEGMLKLEKAGYPIVLHVHDEAIADVPLNSGKSLEEFENIMSELPEWAEGLPLKAEGWVGSRYRK